MILTYLKDTVAYRMHSPKWAAMPTSGAGSAKQGGRANRTGVEALYLALDSATAIQEYKQASLLLPPGMLVSYQLNIEPVVGFRQGYNPEHWDGIWEDFYCDWRELVFNQRIEPPSWVIGDQVVESGAKGVLFSSRLSTGVNLVLYNQFLTEGDSLFVYDPDKSLPKNQDSWV